MASQPLPEFDTATVYSGGSVTRWLRRIERDFADAGYMTPPPSIFLEAIDLLAGGEIEQYMDGNEEIGEILGRAASATKQDVDLVTRLLKSCQFASPASKSRDRDGVQQVTVSTMVGMNHPVQGKLNICGAELKLIVIQAQTSR